MTCAARRILLAVLAVAATVSLPAAHATAPPVPSAAAPSSLAAVTGVVRPVQDYMQRGFDRRSAFLMRQLDALVAAGVPAHIVQPRVKVERSDNPLLCGWRLVFAFGFLWDGDLLAAGDLNGDGRPDVIENHGAERSKKTSTWAVTARDAKTGRPLWTRTRVLGDDEWAFALPFTVGPTARPAVLELRYRYRFVGDVDDITATATAVDGRGRQLWTRAYSGSVHWELDATGLTAIYEHAPVYVVPAQLDRGGMDLLVAVANSATGELRSTVNRVAGKDGRVTRPLSNVPGEVGLVPDQDGDGYLDLYAARVGTSSALSAYKGSTGKQIWVNTALALRGIAVVEDAGVVVGAKPGRHDLAVTTWSAVPDLPGASDLSPAGGPPLAVKPRANNLVALVTGGTGATAWQRPGTEAYALHRAGSPSKGALGVATLTEVQAGVTLELVESIVTYDAAGQPITEQRYTYQHSIECGAGTAVTLPWEGDVDHDGALEGVVFFVIFDDLGFYSDTQLLRGRDGAVLYHPTSSSLGGSVDGQGTDRYSDVGGTGKVTLTARHGDSEKPIWSRSLPVAGRGYTTNSFAVPITSTKCQDIAVVAYGSSGTTSALLASSGQPWWTVSYSSRKDLNGHLTRGHVTSTLC